jgi:hypothetical protein
MKILDEKKQFSPLKLKGRNFIANLAKTEK